MAYFTCWQDPDGKTGIKQHASETEMDAEYSLMRNLTGPTRIAKAISDLPENKVLARWRKHCKE